MKTTSRVVGLGLCGTGICMAIVNYVSVVCENQRLSGSVAALKEERRLSMIRNFDLQWTTGTYADRKLLLQICEAIKQATSNGKAASLERYMDSLRVFKDELTIDNVSSIDAALYRPLRDWFLWKKEMIDFQNADDFRWFARINLELTMYYAIKDVREKHLDYAAHKENGAYLSLRHYKYKFHKERNEELEALATDFIEKWTRQIESSDGFIRQAARSNLLRNTEFAKTVWPGRESARETALLGARAMAAGLIRCGYRPKWLEEFRGSDPTPDPWEVNFNPAKEVEFVAPSSKSGGR